MKDKRAKAVPAVANIRSAKHLKLIQREDTIRKQAQLDGRDPHLLIIADRLARWATHALIAAAPPVVHEWAVNMVSRYGAPRVRIWHTTVDWITALAIARYGEAEDFWPPTFQDGDLLRAAEWHAGAWVPEGVKFAAGASSFGRSKLVVRPS